MDQKALTLVVNGHSFIITGQCGTGKTFLLKKLIKDLILKHHKNVGVTATTGMASSQLSQEATTLHHWSGIMDGRYDKKQLAELFDNDDKFAAAKSRIKQAECLVIDEISMLSKKTFELVEFVCRYVRKTSRIFGGLQIIGCGDFKQLPPVPNYKMQDDGSYCLESEIFKQTFPHHINLTEVVRQNEPDLVQAVHELCDGDPSEETIQLLKSLDRPLPDDVQITHLHGTNFDVNYINHEMLDAMEGREFQFKAKDEGPRNLLCHVTAQKTLLLKEGAPIIFLRNIQDGLFNGARGTVQSLQQDSPPIVNVNGKLITLSPYIFDVYDVNQHKVVASRTQYPIMLAFALTVHRAQGQTLDFVNVDCASFFAPGQLGVAVGRVQRKAGLRIENFNRNAANLKHPKCVYEFYNEETFVEASDDLLCCMSECLSINKPISLEETDDNLASDTQSDFELDIELPQLQHNRNINDFLQENKDTSFISCVSEDLCNTVKFEEHVNFLYFKVHEITSSPFRTKTSQQWNDSYADLNKFLISEEHINACRMLFNVIDLSKQQNKFSSKLMMWLLDREIADKAKEIVDSQKQTTETNRSPKPHSSAGEAKLRYIAGACISKITKRLKISVLQKIGQTSKKSKIARKFDYKMQKMLRQFRINEDEATQDSTMSEIKYKQGPSRGLTIVNDNVFHFFIDLNTLVQKSLTLQHFHLYGENTFSNCRNRVDENDQLIIKWMNLFECTDDSTEDEFIITMIMELFKEVTEHFIRVAFVDALKAFKASVPRKRKQALRTKLRAVGERESKKCKMSSSAPSCSRHDDDDDIDDVSASVYACDICKRKCEWEPSTVELESIACDKCNCWYHYKCVNITGKEKFLTKENTTWYCPKCSRKGKGRGKGKKTK